jgi:hypothetical protein
MNYRNIGTAVSLLVVAAASLLSCSRRPKSNLWGEEVGGLRLGIRSEKTVFKLAEPILLHSYMTNSSSATVTFWESGFAPNTKIQMTDANNRPLSLTTLGASFARAFDPGGARPKNVPITLQPGQTYRMEDEDVQALFAIASPGTYRIQVTYEEAQPTHWKGELVSNQLQIEVQR